MRAVLAGGSGLIGSALAASLLQDGWDVVVLSRPRRQGRPARARARGNSQTPRVADWDGASLGEWAGEIDGADAVVNLSGYPVFSRWHAGTRDLILSSRLDPTRAIGQAIAAAAAPPPVWVNLSAVGYYGETGDRRVDEGSPSGTGFMAETCVRWERACLDSPLPGAARAGPAPENPSSGAPRPEGPRGARPQQAGPGTRRVLARMGVVLSRSGGALGPLASLTKAFLGGHLGHGRQGMSWVHEADAVAVLRLAIERPVEGPLNVTAPHPVSNREFMAALRGTLGRPWSPPVPAFALKIAALAGAPPADVLLEGQYVLPGTAQNAGCTFRFPELESALSDLL